MRMRGGAGCSERIGRDVAGRRVKKVQREKREKSGKKQSLIYVFTERGGANTFVSVEMLYTVKSPP